MSTLQASQANAPDPQATAAAPIGVVVVNWNQPQRTIECVQSVQRSVGVNLAHDAVIVVDNGSTDDSLTLFAKMLPGVTVLSSTWNTGFAAGTNLGLRAALAKGVFATLSLNNDASIAPDALAKLTQRMQADPHLGILEAKTFITDDPKRLWAVGALLKNGRVINVGAAELDQGQYDHTALDSVYGCAIFLRTALLNTVGLFDERFFMYYEDIDLCLRARAAGYRIAMEPAAHVWHDVSVSTRHIPAHRIMQESKSRMQFFAKHLPTRSDRLRFVSTECLYTFSLAARHLRDKNVRGAMAEIHGRLAGLPDFAHPTKYGLPSESASLK